MLNKFIYTILGIGIAFVFFPHTAHDTGKKSLISGIATQKAQARPEKAAPEMALNLSAPQLTAKAALGFDLDSGTILYSKNFDQKLPIASVTKLMTALVVADRLDWNSKVVVNLPGNVIGTTIGLVNGETITVENLLKGMLISSSNDAAEALAMYASGSTDRFAAIMNDEGRKLGLTVTHFDNPVGYDSDSNYSNTLDLIKIATEFLKNEKLAEIVRTKSLAISSADGKYVHNLRTTNQLLLDDSNVEGIKTGFTSKALGNLVILYNHNGSRVITIVLGSDNRELDSKKLLDWLFTVYRW
jgi:D-alanyl-D-alanine carboxypeptidase (penicillin-binding protein 5/6)